jgi:ribosomal-protein-alanine N-acetyltransferase
MKIETDRLLIRSTQETDLESLAELWTDPDVTYYMGGRRNFEEVLNSLIEDLQYNPQPNFNLWPVIEKGTAQIIGHCGIVEKEVEGESEYEIIYILAKSSWGKGFATEAAISLRDFAFKQLGLKRIIALIDPYNSSSERVAVKIGLSYEKDSIRPSGKTVKVFALNLKDC